MIGHVAAVSVSALLMGLGAARSLERIAKGAKAVSGPVQEDPDSLGYFLGDPPSKGFVTICTPVTAVGVEPTLDWSEFDALRAEWERS